MKILVEWSLTSQDIAMNLKIKNLAAEPKMFGILGTLPLRGLGCRKPSQLNSRQATLSPIVSALRASISSAGSQFST